MTDDIWIIDISGYGAFVFRGDEEDCDHLRAGKAKWEGGVGRMWRAAEGLTDPERVTKTAKACCQQFDTRTWWLTPQITAPRQRSKRRVRHEPFPPSHHPRGIQAGD